jgi:NAD(P)-dependent dehydrogenase (short-subunit alcohol dehydrogenase family)
MISSLLTDKVVIVTGGAGLLGRSFCRAIVDHGGMAVIADIDERLGKNVSDSLGENGAVYVRLDINGQESINDLIAVVSKKFGKIDALVNNAYPRTRNYGCRFEDVTREDFCENISLHLGGYFLVAQQFVRFFRGQGYGNIVNMASIYGTLAPRFEIYRDTTMTMPVEYAVIKAGVFQLTRYLSKYLKGDNIRVNAISPGGVVDSQPEPFLNAYQTFCLNKGLLEPRDVAGALVFLLSDMSQFVNGHNLVVDDGFSL